MFEDCIVPPENLVGTPISSMHHTMRNLEIERVALAVVVGISRRCLADMSRYAGARGLGKPIREFGQMQRHIGESWAEYRAMRVLMSTKHLEFSTWIPGAAS